MTDPKYENTVSQYNLDEIFIFKLEFKDYPYLAENRFFTKSDSIVPGKKSH